MSGISTTAFARWNQLTAEIADPGNRERLPELLLQACYAVLPADNGMVALFGKDIKPLPLYDDVPSRLHKQVIQKYYDGAYLLDPYYRAAVDGMKTGLYRLSEIAPPGFRQSEYYKIYYKDSSTGDEAGFLCHLPDGYVGYISLATEFGKPNFRLKDINALRSALPVVDQYLRKIYSDIHSDTNRDSSELHSQLEVALGKFGSSLLTSRESEVIRLYLQGHSTQSISNRLGISPHTVSMHRKNSYGKLDISSQFELFHLFIDSLSCYDTVAQDDPLRAYLAVSS